jgi:hypothetical protein
MSTQPVAAHDTVGVVPIPMVYGQGPAAQDRMAGEPDWTSRRRASPLNDLLNPTLRWSASLPRAIRPLALMNRFPRLANLVAASWKEPLSFRACLDDLLTDRRGGRQGLPPDVREELDNLRRYYYFRECPQQGSQQPTGAPTG